MDEAKPPHEVVEIRSGSLEHDLERARRSGGWIRFCGRGSYSAPDLNCVRGASWVRRVELYDLVKCDLTALSSLANLTVLHINGDLDHGLRIDLSQSTGLKSIAAPWTSAVRLPGEDAQLEFVALTGGDSDLSSLPGWKTLRVLRMSRAKITSCTGIERFQSLEELRLESAPLLTDIDALGSLEHLHKCEWIGCAQLQSIDGLGACSHLKDVLIAACRGITDISVLASLPELESLRLVQVPDLARQALAWKNGITVRAYPTPRASKRPSRTKAARAHASDSPALAALRRGLPTLAWKERMEDADETFTRAGIRAAERHLNAFLDRVGGMAHGSAELSSGFREIVQTFNALNAEHPGLLETSEREELAGFLGAVAAATGFDHDGDDVTAAWRTDW